jgi:hypothetical protein
MIRKAFHRSSGFKVWFMKRFGNAGDTPSAFSATFMSRIGRSKWHDNQSVYRLEPKAFSM